MFTELQTVELVREVVTSEHTYRKGERGTVLDIHRERKPGTLVRVKHTYRVEFHSEDRGLTGDLLECEPEWLRSL